MNSWLKNLKENFQKVWDSFSKIQKITLILVMLASVTLIGTLAFLNNRVIYEPLFTELESKNAALIKQYLDKKAITYKITNDGSTIEVDKNAKYSIRLDISKEGLIPTNGTVGFEIFDSAKIGATEFDKKMMYLRAQKGELERTIGALDAVKKASVSITPANDSPFADEKTGAKASVLLQLDPLSKLTEENIKSIIVLVASSVEGMSQQDVSVVDTNGSILSDRVDLENEGNLITKKRIELQKEMEKQLEKKANDVLSVLGVGNFKVQVAIELDFDKEAYTTESYTTPTINGEQGTDGIVRSVQSKDEAYSTTNGATNPAEGVAGTTTNIPEYVGTESQNANSNYNKNEKTVNYEMDKKNLSYEKSIGQIKRMSVSVTLNKDSSYFKDKEVKPEDKAQFQKIVESAVALNLRRGDTINVDVIPFNTDALNEIQLAAEKEAKKIRNMYIAAGSLLGFLLLLIIGYIIYKALEAKKLRQQEAKAIEELLPQMEELELEEKVSVEEQERMDQENQIKQIAKQKPEEVAALIKNWLGEE